MSTPTLARPVPALLGGDMLYVADNEFLRLTSRNSTSNVRLALAWRTLPLAGAPPIANQQPHTPATDRSSATVDAFVGAGWLQGVSVIVTSGAPLYGSCYVRVDLMRAQGTVATVVQTLLRGYVTAGQAIGFPGAWNEPAIFGSANIRSITGTDPGAGAEISETVPTGARWRLLALRAALVTDATVTNREVAITFDDGATVYAEFASGANQTATLTRQYTASRQGPRGAAATGTSILIATSDLWLPAGHRIRTLTTNLQAGDNWGAPQLLVNEELEAAA